MTLDNVFAQARSLLEEHNAAISDQSGQQPGQIKIDQFFGLVKIAGGTSVDRLGTHFRWEDIQKLLHQSMVQGMVDGHNVAMPEPVGLAKDVANVFRSEKTAEVSSVGQTQEKTNFSPKKVAGMSVRALVENFDPSEPDNAVANRLKTVSKGHPFIVFSEGRTVDIETSFKILEEVRKGMDPMTEIVVGGKPKRIYNIGELPDDFLDENPIYAGRPLRFNDVCDQTQKPWAGVSTEVRQLVRIIVERYGCKSHDEVLNLITKAVMPNAWATLVSDYPKAATVFEDLKSSGQLPRLKLRLNSPKKGGETSSSHPFQQGKKVKVDPQTKQFVRNMNLRANSPQTWGGPHLMPENYSGYFGSTGNVDLDWKYQQFWNDNKQE